MDELIERIAKEAAGAAVSLSRPQRELRIAGWLACRFSSSGSEVARHDAARAAEALAPVIAAAIRRYLLTCPLLGGPAGDERLAELEQYWLDPVPADAGTITQQEMKEVFAHLRHLTRVVQEIAAGGPEYAVYARGYDHGRRAGAKEQKKADLDAAGEGLTSADVREAVRDAPLVAGDTPS